jgi:hypothetical protein
MLVPFQMFGAPIAAAAHDATGSYDAAIFGFSAACLVGAAALVPVRVPAVRGAA